MARSQKRHPHDKVTLARVHNANNQAHKWIDGLIVRRNKEAFLLRVDCSGVYHGVLLPICDKLSDLVNARCTLCPQLDSSSRGCLDSNSGIEALHGTSTFDFG
eukprot:2831819-Pleurochrysis_carterae.AAC.2